MKVFLLILFFFTSTFLLAQEEVGDPLPNGDIEVENYADTAVVETSKLFSGKPGKAMLYSLVLPGAGQGIINKKLWKVPFVYGALGGMAFVMIDSRKEFRRFQDALIAQVDGEEHEFTGFLDSAEAIKPYRDRAQKTYENNVIYFSLLWVLQSVEAFVDAHLIGFEVSEDLSFRPKPAIIPVGNQGIAMGIGIAISF